jgi:spore maturation protein CgeB
MLILYVAMKYDYGQSARGLSFEHYNFYDALVNMGHDIVYFDFLSLMQRRGRESMNRRLAEVAAAEKPDLLFCVLFKEELDRDTIRGISESGRTVTLNWFCDDQRRFEDYSRFWAPCFNWVITTAQSAVPKYRTIGYANVIKSQWACNHFLYRKLDLPLKHDVTFVGQPHGNRREVVQYLADAGIKVDARGQGWEAGRISQEKMVELFNQSRINLNLSNSSVPIEPVGQRVMRAVRRAVSASLDALPMGGFVKAAGRKMLGAATAPQPSARRKGRFVEQIKGRNFEVPGCGGFLLTGMAENLGDYYRPGLEVGCFGERDDLLAKVRHYLDHEEERAAVALAGYRRTMAEHTYAHRFTEAFGRMGLKNPGLSDVLAAKVKPGQTQEVD